MLALGVMIGIPVLLILLGLWIGPLQAWTQRHGAILWTPLAVVASVAPVLRLVREPVVDWRVALWFVVLTCNVLLIVQSHRETKRCQTTHGKRAS